MSENLFSGEVTLQSAEPFEYRRYIHPFSKDLNRSCPGELANLVTTQKYERCAEARHPPQAPQSNQRSGALCRKRTNVWIVNRHSFAA